MLLGFSARGTAECFSRHSWGSVPSCNACRLATYLMYSKLDQKPSSHLPCGPAHGNSNSRSPCPSAPSANGLLSDTADTRINIKSCLQDRDDVWQGHAEEHSPHCAQRSKLPIAQKLLSRTCAQQMCGSLKLRDVNRKFAGTHCSPGAIGQPDGSQAAISDACTLSSLFLLSVAGMWPRGPRGESREQCQPRSRHESELGAFLTAGGKGNLLIPADPCSSKLVLPYANTGVLKSLSSNDVRPTGLQELSLLHLALERLQIF